MTVNASVSFCDEFKVSATWIGMRARFRVYILFMAIVKPIQQVIDFWNYFMLLYELNMVKFEVSNFK